MTKNSRQKTKYLEEEKSFQSEIKSIFHHFKRDFICQKLSQTLECTFNIIKELSFYHFVPSLFMIVLFFSLYAVSGWRDFGQQNNEQDHLYFFVFNFPLTERLYPGNYYWEFVWTCFLFHPYGVSYPWYIKLSLYSLMHLQQQRSWKSNILVDAK